MKRKALSVIGFVSLALISVLPVPAQTTAFTYQGRLNSSNAPVSGLYDLRFTLYVAKNR